MSDSLVDRLGRIGAGTAAQREEDDQEIVACGAFGFLRGIRDRAFNIEFRRCKGTWPALEYAWLANPIWEPAGAILLPYVTGHQVVMRGRNLRHLHERILSHQVVWVQEAGEKGRDFFPEQDTVIYEIDYREPAGAN